MDKSVLKKALADSEDPTPGYLFRDITQMTFVDQITQDKLLAFLLSYLDPKVSVHVLSKCLRIIKHLCEEGHADFQKQMQSKADLLRQFASYRGPNDPKYGDKLNEKVRDCARAAIEAAFSHRRESRVQIASGTGSNTVVNEVKSGFATGHSVSAGATGGNAHMAPMPQENTYAKEMARRGAVPGVVPAAGGFVQDVKKGFNTGFGLWAEGVKSTQDRVLEGGEAGSFQAVEIASAGFGFAQGGGASSASASSTTAEWKFTSEASGASAGGLMARQERVLNRYQSEMERVCQFQNAPQRVELANFLEKVAEIHNETRLPYDELAAAIDERLAQKHPWPQRLNALTVLEYLLKNNPPPQLPAYFAENPEDVHRNVHVVQTALKDKAQKVLKLLGLQERKAPSANEPAVQLSSAAGHGETTWSAPTSSAPAAGAGSELDLGGMTVTRGARGGRGGAGATAPASKLAEVSEQPGKLKKRAQMAVADDEAQQQPAPAQSSAWGNASWGAASQEWGAQSLTAQGAQSSWGQPTPVASGQFAASGFGAAPASAPAPSAPAPRAAPAATSLDDLFGPSPVTTTSVAPPPASANMFVGMTVAPSAPPAPAPAAAWGAPAPAQQQPSWGAPAPAPAPAAAWGAPAAPAPAPQSSWGAPPPAPAPAPADPNAQRAALQQRMIELQQQMAAVMQTPGGPDPVKLQAILAAQQQLIADMGRIQQGPAAPAPAPRPEAFAALHDDIRTLANH